MTGSHEREHGAELVRLVVCCLVAQAAVVVATGMPFARGGPPAIAGALPEPSPTERGVP